MKLIVGLGNPGKQYELTRHNVGFMVIDFLSKNLKISLNQTKFNGQYVKTKYQEHDIILLKPQTFMNLSGHCVHSFMNYFKIHEQDVLVIHDEVDLPFGKIQFKQGGSHAGHNGLKDIFTKNNSNIARLRIGIDKNPNIKTADWVLGKFSNYELIKISNNQNLLIESILTWISNNDFNIIMNKFNNQQFKE